MAEAADQTPSDAPPLPAMIPTLDPARYRPDEDALRHALGIPDAGTEAAYARQLSDRLVQSGLVPRRHHPG